MIYRSYNPEKDDSAALRIWQECGWLSRSIKEKDAKPFKNFVKLAKSSDVVEHNGEAECLITSHQGRIQYLEKQLPLQVISSVTVSHLLRKQGAAGNLLAHVIARGAQSGDVYSGLGMFDQGFYNKHGYGNLPYAEQMNFDPATLQVPKLQRTPARLSKKDISAMIQNMKNHRPNHGLAYIESKEFYLVDIDEPEGQFGLGFYNDRGELTHHIWGGMLDENGPLIVDYMVYQNYDGLLEILSLLKSLSDQIHLVKMREPKSIQMQDFLSRPVRSARKTEWGKYRLGGSMTAWQQMRILRMEEALAALSLPVASKHGFSFNLVLDDPIEQFLKKDLPEDITWRGIGGEWTITVRQDSSQASRGHTDGLPCLRSSVNGFTRMILGVLSPSALALSEDMEAPKELWQELDRVFILPKPDTRISF